MSVCFHWSNKSLCIKVPLMLMIVNYLYYISLPYCLYEKRLSHGFYMPPPNRNGPTFIAKKILPNFWHTAILTASVGNNNTDGRILKFHSFLDLRER